MHARQVQPTQGLLRKMIFKTFRWAWARWKAAEDAEHCGCFLDWAMETPKATPISRAFPFITHSTLRLHSSETHLDYFLQIRARNPEQTWAGKRSPFARMQTHAKRDLRTNQLENFSFDLFNNIWVFDQTFED